jgi:hypothetical protein
MADTASHIELMMMLQETLVVYPELKWSSYYPCQFEKTQIIFESGYGGIRMRIL